MLVFLIKIYGVAHFSLTTTTGLLTASPVQVALGTVTIYAYHVIPALAFGTCWPAVRTVRTSTGRLAGYRDRRDRGDAGSPFQYLVLQVGVVAVALLLEAGLWWLGRGTPRRRWTVWAA